MKEFASARRPGIGGLSTFQRCAVSCMRRFCPPGRIQRTRLANRSNRARATAKSMRLSGLILEPCRDTARFYYSIPEIISLIIGWECLEVERIDEAKNAPLGWSYPFAAQLHYTASSRT